MRAVLVTLVILSGCSGDANHLGNPLLLPLSGGSTLLGNAIYNQRRGAVEVYVKTNHPAILSDIRNNGGAHLDEAMDIAQIPTTDRNARIIQLSADIALYETSPEALIVALMVYGQ
ncbi:hypothetical protein [Loktanella sp. S4079]|uniref:hypothetical protein n=1 Tax=Loktanella sp. S4079 TaxID=579483 RepID=UPI0005FA7792|nr:hypothetical protein [Loktanella sp. S4079]KJZ20224.1 hypothetical protein TW80_05175 [Loktanella sp. S4079]